MRVGARTGVISWLFLLQVITAFVLAGAVLATGSRLIASAGAGFALATLGGYLLSVWAGLFGFREIRTTAGIVARMIEVAAFATLAALAAAPGTPGQRPAGQAGTGSPLLARLQAGIPGAGPVVGTISFAALEALGISAAQAGRPASPPPHGALKTAKIGGVTVLTTAKGFTLYWFAPDTPTPIHLQWDVRRLLAAGNRDTGGGAGRHRHARLDQTVRRHDTGHLHRAPPLHLRRRHRPRPGLRQQPQPQRRTMARSNRAWLSHGPHALVRTAAVLQELRRMLTVKGYQPPAACCGKRGFSDHYAERDRAR
jgi:hypothetical protein